MTTGFTVVALQVPHGCVDPNVTDVPAVTFEPLASMHSSAYGGYTQTSFMVFYSFAKLSRQFSIPSLILFPSLHLFIPSPVYYVVSLLLSQAAIGGYHA